MQSAIQGHGYKIAVSSDPARIEKVWLAEHKSVQAWVVILADEDRWDEPVSDLIEYSDAPVLFGLDKAPGKQSGDYPKWERRLFSKLEELLGEPAAPITLEESVAVITEPEKVADKNTRAPELPPHIKPRGPGDPVNRVIILAASLGGPEAVKEFLDCLPAGLPAAFIYAQHIDKLAADVLLRVLGRHSELTLQQAKAGEKLRNGEIVIVPVEHEISFDADGLIVFHSHPWPGPYGPSINQVMLNVANYYRSQTNVILFSGMGNDGAVAGPLLKAYGSSVWCQSSESCVSSSMPDAVSATGCVEFRGTPSELAEQLVTTIASEELKKSRPGSVET
jgi:chemosensory pili system protein ChpB (putative protein-glutamate methylesterase)